MGLSMYKKNSQNIKIPENLVSKHDLIVIKTKLHLQLEIRKDIIRYNKLFTLPRFLHISSLKVIALKQLI